MIGGNKKITGKFTEKSVYQVAFIKIVAIYRSVTTHFNPKIANRGQLLKMDNFFLKHFDYSPYRTWPFTFNSPDFVYFLLFCSFFLLATAILCLVGRNKHNGTGSCICTLRLLKSTHKTSWFLYEQEKNRKGIVKL